MAGSSGEKLVSIQISTHSIDLLIHATWARKVPIVLLSNQQEMRYQLLLGSLVIFTLGANAAFLSKKEKGFHYYSKALTPLFANFSIEGKRVFRKSTEKGFMADSFSNATNNIGCYNCPQNKPEQEAKRIKNKTLGSISLILSMAAWAVLPTPMAPLSILLIPAAIITGIISVSRSGKFENKRNSGYTHGLIGLISSVFLIILFSFLLLCIAAI